MLKNHLIIALRNLRKQPFYTSINVFGLALGMACTLLIALYIRHELSYDRFHQHADRIYRLGTHGIISESEFTYPFVFAGVKEVFENEIPAVEQAVRLRQYNDKIIKRGDIVIQEDKVVTADSGFFSLFTFPLAQGDPTQVLQQPNSVVMTSETARKYFQEEVPIGQQILIDGQPFQVSGIMKPVPESSHIHFSMVYSIQSDTQNEGEWGDVNTYTYFRLNDQANIADVDAQLDPLMRKYYRDYDELKELGYTLEMFTQPLIDIHLYSNMGGELEPNGNSKYLYIFGSVALFILLIACINFMNLATARSADRAKEVGIRKTMGSLRSWLIGQFLTESLLLSLVSVVFALGLAELLRIPFNKIAGLEYQLPYTKGWFVPAILLLGIAVGVLAGSYPAFYLTRFQPVQVLRGRLATSSQNKWFRNSLVVFQFVISIALIVCTLIVYEQLQFIRNKDLGFEKESVIVLSNTSALGTKQDEFRQALLGLHDVQEVGFSSVSPLTRYDGTIFKPPVISDSIIGSTYQDENALVMSYIHVSHDYLPTMGIKLKEGRNFSRSIAADSTNYAIILNEQAVRKLNLTDPVGTKIETFGGVYESKIIGVAKDFHFKSLHTTVEPLALILSKDLNVAEVKIQSTDLPWTITTIEAQWNQHSDGTPFTFSFLDQNFDALFRADKRVGMIFGSFALLTIIIACLGSLALAAFMAEQRTKEIGIRKVLGASVKSIVLLLSKDFTRLVIVAIVVATPLAYWAMQQWLGDFAYRIAIGFSTFALAGTTALLIAVLTVSYQSIKAALANPVDSLRNE